MIGYVKRRLLRQASVVQLFIYELLSLEMCSGIGDVYVASWRNMSSLRLQVMGYFSSFICLGINKSVSIDEKKLCRSEFMSCEPEFCRKCMVVASALDRS